MQGFDEIIQPPPPGACGCRIAAVCGKTPISEGLAAPISCSQGCPTAQGDPLVRRDVQSSAAAEAMDLIPHMLAALRRAALHNALLFCGLDQNTARPCWALLSLGIGLHPIHLMRSELVLRAGPATRSLCQTSKRRSPITTRQVRMQTHQRAGHHAACPR